jgi:uncharacterized RDD family membrane protein YckC
MLRGFARALDLALHIGALELAGRAQTLLPGPLLTLDDAALLGVDAAVGLTAFVLAPALSEALGGATLGKVLLGLEVVSAEDDGPINLGRAVTRNVALVVDVLFFGLVAYSAMARSERRQRVGDAWARSWVVRRAGPPTRRAIGVALLGPGVALALLLASYVVA